MTDILDRRRCAPLLLVLGAAIFSASFLHGEPFVLRFSQPTMDRWMYPFNSTPGCRASASVFGTLGDESGVDSRHGQFLVGFDTITQTVTNCGSVSDLPSLLATNQGPARYLLQQARLTAVINRGGTFRYDPTQDAFTSFFEPSEPGRTEDLDTGRPIELFGVGFRNGYAVDAFWEDAPFGESAVGQRNAFCVGYNTNGALVDVSNNVGKTNELFPHFEVPPFATGLTSSVKPGDLVPSETVFTFELNLRDPLVLQYLQQGLDGGRLRFMITSLHTSSFGGQPSWPDFYTRDNLVGTPPTLEIEGTVVSSTDADGDGLPDDWEVFYFGSLSQDAQEDSDSDGISNLNEYLAGTDPTDAASGLRILDIRQEATGTVVLRFPFAASRTYSVESSSDLKSWSQKEEHEVSYDPVSGIAQWREEGGWVAEPNASRFYRIQAE